MDKILDLGGGPDFGIGAGKRGIDEVSLLKNLENVTPRSVYLARENPTAKVVVLDPQIPSVLAKKYKIELPNLHFVEGEVKRRGLKHQIEIGLPFPKETYDRVEMNFLFTPVSFDEWNPYSSPLEWIKAGITDVNQIPVYARALEETSRVLKPGGRLVICERGGRINAIRRALSTDDGLKLDSEFLDENDLNYVSFKEVVDSSGRSPQAVSSQRTKDVMLQHNDVRAEDFRIYELEFVKKGAR